MGSRHADAARAVRLGTAASGAPVLAEVRATVPDVEAPPPIGSGRTVYLPRATLERLATLPGDGPMDQVDAALDRAGVPRGTP